MLHRALAQFRPSRRNQDEEEEEEEEEIFILPK